MNKLNFSATLRYLFTITKHLVKTLQYDEYSIFLVNCSRYLARFVWIVCWNVYQQGFQVVNIWYINFKVLEGISIEAKQGKQKRKETFFMSQRYIIKTISVHSLSEVLGFRYNFSTILLFSAWTTLFHPFCTLVWIEYKLFSVWTTLFHPFCTLVCHKV